jgi:CRISPR-associated endonuclease/helicase Cas3
MVNEPCYLVTTQLIEAGVDVDFPLVLRAIGPLDSIVQAAGRCNREGRLPMKGTVIVFDPSESNGLPDPRYKTGIATMQEMLKEGTVDPEDPKTFRRYFQKMYSRMNTDKLDIQALRKNLEYEKVATKFKMIEEDTVSVIVLYDQEQVKKLLEEDLQKNLQKARMIMRQLQPYMVSIQAEMAEKAKSHGLIEEISGVLVYKGVYDRMYGLLIDKTD